MESVISNMADCERLDNVHSGCGVNIALERLLQGLVITLVLMDMQMDVWWYIG